MTPDQWKFIGIDWKESWPAFALGFSVGAFMFIIAFSLVLCVCRKLFYNTGSFSVKSEVA